MKQKFESYDECYRYLLKYLYENGKIVKASTKKEDEYKKEIKELRNVSYTINDGRKTIINIPKLRQFPFWQVSEVLSEILNIDPPIYSKYRPDLYEFSYKLNDDGKAPYQYSSRWREYNQLTNLFSLLKNNINSKRAVMATYMPYDTSPNHKDVPCTLLHHFIHRDNKLNLTTIFRSTDIFRGSRYDFSLSSFLLMGMVSWLKNEGKKVDVGDITHHHTSLHYYPYQDKEKMQKALENLEQPLFYDDVEPSMINLNIKDYYKNLRRIVDAESASYQGNFNYAEKKLEKIVEPLFRDYARVYLIRNSKHYKRDDLKNKYKSGIECEDMKKWVK